MTIDKKKITIGVAVLIVLIAAYFLFIKKKKGSSNDHPGMSGWSELKRKFFKDWVMTKATAWKTQQAEAGKWPEIYVQADEWGLGIDAAIQRHNEWDYESGTMIAGYIDTDWWKNAWNSYKLQNGLDENGHKI